MHRSPLVLLPSFPTSFVALPLTLGIFRASHVAEVAVTWGSLDLTAPQSFAVATFTPVFFIWLISCLYSQSNPLKMFPLRLIFIADTVNLAVICLTVSVRVA